MISVSRRAVYENYTLLLRRTTLYCYAELHSTVTQNYTLLLRRTTLYHYVELHSTVTQNYTLLLRRTTLYYYAELHSTIVLTSYKTAPHNRYQLHPAEPQQHTKCSNGAFVLLKMGIMMPKHVETEVNNKYLIVAACWFSLPSYCVEWYFYPAWCGTTLGPWTCWSTG